MNSSGLKPCWIHTHKKSPMQKICSVLLRIFPCQTVILVPDNKTYGTQLALNSQSLCQNRHLAPGFASLPATWLRTVEPATLLPQLFVSELELIIHLPQRAPGKTAGGDTGKTSSAQHLVMPFLSTAGPVHSLTFNRPYRKKPSPCLAAYIGPESFCQT